MGFSVNFGSDHSRGRYGRYGRRRKATPLGTMIAGIVVVLIGGGFYMADQSKAARVAAVKEEGEIVEAEAYGHRSEQEVRYDNDNRRRTSTNYYVSLRFTDENGQQQVISDRKVSRTIHDASRGGTIRVGYMPDDSGTIVFPDHESDEPNPWIAFIIGIVGLLLAGFGFFQFQRQRSQAGSGGAEPEGEGGAGPELRRQDESEEI